MTEREPYIAYCTCGKLTGLAPIEHTTRTCPDCINAMLRKGLKHARGGSSLTSPVEKKVELDRIWEETPDEPQIEPLPVLHEFVLDHYEGAGTWGLWTRRGTLLKQAALEDVMDFLERWEE